RVTEGTSLFLGEQLAERRLGGRGGFRRSPACGLQNAMLRLALAQKVNTMIGRYARNPACKGLTRVIAAHSAWQPRKNIVSRVLGLFRRSQHLAANGQHARVELAVELAEHFLLKHDGGHSFHSVGCGFCAAMARIPASENSAI